MYRYVDEIDPHNVKSKVEGAVADIYDLHFMEN